MFRFIGKVSPNTLHSLTRNKSEHKERARNCEGQSVGATFFMLSKIKVVLGK